MTTTRRKVRAAVLREAGTPLVVEELWLEAPQAGEIRVRVEVAGVCHSDYHYMSGDLTCHLPAVLGHEGAGVVEEVGPGVTSVAVGDHVLFLWRAGCGRCEYCAKGRPALCASGQQVRSTGHLPAGGSRWTDLSGNEVKHFLGISCLAEQTVVDESAVMKVDSSVPFRDAALAGCAVMSGVGAVMNAAKVVPGDSVVVVGAGGVGLSVVMGARAAGASRIVVVDLNPERLEMSVAVGATDTINPTEMNSVAAGVRELEPEGVDHSFEVVGRDQTIRDAVSVLKRGGTATLVGLARVGLEVPVNALDLVLAEKRVQGSLYGSSSPYRDYPRIFEMVESGQLPLDQIPTEEFGLGAVNEGFYAMLEGRVARALVVPALD